ncbi:MAG TPA: histidine kinase [Beijerinckiaceae bacterium]|jgi:hypothetical protein
MADYYPLIMRAVQGLSDPSPEMRRVVYDRASEALLAQLRSLDPPMSESDITRERLSLEAAVRRVEAEHGNTLPEAALPRAEAPSRPAESPSRPSEAFARPAEPRQEAEPPAPVSALHAAHHLPEASPPTDDPARTSPPVPFELPSRERTAARELGPEAASDIVEGVQRPRVDTVEPELSRPGRFRSVVLGLVVLLVVGAIAVAAWYLRDDPADLAREPAVAETAPPAPAESKFGERVTGGDRPATPAAPPAVPGRADLPVAQRAMLFEENQADPQNPRATAGRVVWRLDAVNAGQGQPLETAVRASVEIPGQTVSMNFVLRRNLDAALPASHTIELTFTTPSGEPTRAIRDVGLLQLKNEEAARGTPIAGLPVPVRDNLFLIGLSNLPADQERNTELLTRRNWLDLPLRFVSGQRAIISLEKGLAGEQVMNQAFERWR